MPDDPRQIDWFDPKRLLRGNPRQREAAKTLHKLKIYKALREFTPVLCGTIPIDCDLPASDLDIICCATDFDVLESKLTVLYESKGEFSLSRKELAGEPSLVCRFRFGGRLIEIVAQRTPVARQRAFGHMLAEALLIHRRGERIKERVRELKSEGHTTEEAFALLFSLAGDPYEALMDIYLQEFALEKASGD